VGCQPVVAWAKWLGWTVSADLEQEVFPFPRFLVESNSFKFELLKFIDISNKFDKR
jgi:hypothetical protein